MAFLVLGSIHSFALILFLNFISRQTILFLNIVYLEFLSLTVLMLLLVSLKAKYPSDLIHSSTSNLKYFISISLNDPHCFSVIIVKHVHGLFT